MTYWRDEEVIKAVVGRKLKGYSVDADKEGFTLEFEDGGARFVVKGDCCSHSWIEHLEAAGDLTGAVIEAFADGEQAPDIDGDYGDVTQVYSNTFRTSKGDLKLEYRNESNGYYGGWLELEKHWQD